MCRALGVRGDTSLRRGQSSSPRCTSFEASAGRASSAGAQLAEQRPSWFVAGGQWGVALLLIGSAVLAGTLARGNVNGRLRRVVSVRGALLPWYFSFEDSGSRSRCSLAPSTVTRR